MNNSVLRVGLLISTLKSGGAERSVVNLANALTARGYAVSVLTYSTPETDFYTLAPASDRVSLDLMRASSGPLSAVINNIKRLGVVRAAIRKHKLNVLISFMDSTNVTAVLAGLGGECRVIVSERIHPEQHNTGFIWALLRKAVYRHAAQVVVQTRQVKNWISQHTSANKVSVVPNFFVPPGASTSAPVDYLQRPKVILAAGRLCDQKGFDLLIDAFAIAIKRPLMAGWQLRIFGEGELRDDLQKQILDAGLQSSIELAGNSDKLFEIMQHSRNFILSSRNEGFPNVLLEAMNAGCAVAGFADVSGVADLIEHRSCGLSVAGCAPDGLADAMVELCIDEQQSAGFAAAARLKAAGYSENAIVPLWERCFEG